MTELLAALWELLLAIGKLAIALAGFTIIISPFILLFRLHIKNVQKREERENERIKELLDYHAKQVAKETAKLNEISDATTIHENISTEELLQIIESIDK